MRLLIASMAALAAVVVAAPSFAQDDANPAPVPATKAKPATTAASCQKLKTSSQRNACLKKVNMAKAQPAATPKAATTTKAKAKKPATTPAATKQPDVGQLAPPPAAATPSTGTVAVPPLPQKTI